MPTTRVTEQELVNKLKKLVEAVCKTATGTAKREDFREVDSCIRDIYAEMCGLGLADTELDYILGKEK